MMKNVLSILLISLLALFAVSEAVTAQDALPVTIKDLNTYEDLTSADDIPNHPLVGETVTFTAVVVSNPKTSGLASYNSTNDAIGRIHVFVMDTTALSMGREGMAIQIVQGSSTSAFAEFENAVRGDVIEVIGSLTFFNSVGQFVIDEIVTNLGNVNDGISGLDAYASLLEPWEVSPSAFHISNGPSEIDLDLDAYQIYNGQYVKITNGIMANYSGDVTDIGGENVVGRPGFTVNKDGVFVANRDIGLRYRNDRSDAAGGYKTGYNFIRSTEDGFFERPPAGSAVDISGFLVIDSFTTGFTYTNGVAFHISPMEDGVLWLEGTRLENGVGGFVWPDDLIFVASPPQVVDVTLSPDQGGVYSASDVVTVNAIVAAPEDDPTVTVDSVHVIYTDANGMQAIPMVDGGSGNYSVELPALTAFDSPSLYVEAYGDNGLTGRFPVTGAITFFVDGGAITSIEQIQKTSDEMAGPSPIAGLEDLVFDITATVVSGAVDGVIAVQDGTGPWSGVFVGLSGSTASLNRGDVITITGALVQEASVASNSSVTYTYLSNLVFTPVSTGGDLSAVVPELTTDEFNAVSDPGEAWEGMLVSFPNVRLIADEGFGELSVSTIVDETTVQESTIILNEDTRAGAVGETGYPGNVNLHARYGNDMTKVSGLVTYTFGAPKIIPRDLGDLEGENFTIPRPEFDLLAPADMAEVEVTDDITISWQALDPADYDGDEVTYTWNLFAAADTTTLLSLPSANDGKDPEITLPYETVDGFLSGLGLAVGESAEALWNVVVSDGTSEHNVAEFYSFSSASFIDLYYGVTLTRGTATSIEEDLMPKTFELSQNFPNPFNPSTQIRYAVPQISEVRLDVYNMIGQRVATLVNEEKLPGNYSIDFDASTLSSGIYFYRLQAGSVQLTRKMMLVK